MTTHKLQFGGVPSSETCDCQRRVNSCRWFKCGQPGPQEHAYKCEVFNATAGNFTDHPARLRNIGHLMAHVLGYTDGLPHSFGACGKLWTLAALHYRLRDGALASSMALLLTPRPVPVPLVPTIQKLGKSEREYVPLSHRLFDLNPFNGLGAGRHGIERKSTLSHVAIAVWSAHASWLARSSMGGNVNWDMWQLDHIAPPPAQLLGLHEPGHFSNRMKSFSSSMLKDLPTPSDLRNFPPPARFKDLPTPSILKHLPPTTGPRRLVVVNHTPTPSQTTETSETLSSPPPETPPAAVQSRPRSFAAFADWDIPHTPPATTRAIALPKNHRFSCGALNGLASGQHVSRPLPDPFMSAPRGILILQNDNDSDSTYYLANESLPFDDTESSCRPPLPSPYRV